MAEFRFPSREQAEEFAAEQGGTVEYDEAGATIPFVDDYRPYVVIVQPVPVVDAYGFDLPPVV